MPTIRHELIIGVPAEKAYDAITSQKGLSAWWTPDTIAKAEVSSIARFTFGTYFKEMKIVALRSPELVKWICISGDDEWIGTTLSFKLESGDNRTLLNSHPETRGQMEQQNTTNSLTLLIFQHDDWKEYTPMYAECNYTWGQFLRSLKLFCETGKGTPWPNQHRTSLL